MVQKTLANSFHDAGSTELSGRPTDQECTMKHVLHTTIVIFLVVLTGCAAPGKHRDATETFGLATERIGRMGESEFVAIRSGIIRMNKFQAVMDRSATSRTIAYDEPVPAAETAKRVSASKSLRHYGDLLMRLASDDRTQFVRRAAVTFADSVGETLGGELTNAQEEAIAGVIAGLDGYWSQSRKTRTIRDVVLAFEDSVAAMADLLLTDLSLNGPNSFLGAYDATARRLQASAEIIIDGGDASGGDERKKAVDAYYLARSSRVRAQEIGARIEAGDRALKAVNAEIASGARGGDCDLALIKEYGRQIQKIENMQHVLP